MSVFRIEKNSNYTVMSNYHLKERTMSLKAKGLLSLMLSLPESWDYSLAGLVSICKESETAIKSTLDELKAFGYLTMTKHQNAKGQFAWDYSIFENPLSEEERDAQPAQAEPYPQNPPMDNPPMENIGEVNTKQSNTDILNTNSISKKVVKAQNSDEFNAETSFVENEIFIFPTVEKRDNVFSATICRHGKNDADWAFDIIKTYIDEYYPKVKGRKHWKLNKAQRMGFAKKFLKFLDEYNIAEDEPEMILQSILSDKQIPDPTILIATDPKVLGYHALKIGCVDYSSLQDTEYCPVENYY